MNNDQKELSAILSEAIRGRYNLTLKDSNTNLKNIFDEARSHEIHTIIFPLIKKTYGNKDFNKELISEWSKISVLSAIHQIQHINQMKKVLHEFNTAGIPVIVLKGLALRSLYPNPEFRTMGDADILVHQEDMSKSKQLLIRLGYTENNSDLVHCCFYKEKHLPIELHWTLVNEAHIKTATKFQENIWNNTVSINMLGEQVLALSPASQLMHVCLHMAVHFLSNGFGLRQLCDFVLLFELEKRSIDWDFFYEDCKMNGIEKFVISIFAVCSQLFDIEIPNNNYLCKSEDSKYIDMFIDEIFSAGVHGKKDIARISSTSILRLQDCKNPNTSKNKFSIALSFLFPPPEKLDIRYSYTKKFYILTPIAWIHRLIYSIFRKNFYIFKKFTNFSSSLSISENHFKVIRWLNIE
jgi:hypothetical protein